VTCSFFEEKAKFWGNTTLHKFLEALHA